MKKYINGANAFPAEKIDDSIRGIPQIDLDILYSRGFDTPGKINNFLFPSFLKVVKEREIQDLKKAAFIIKEAVKEEATMVVYHDYDVDGISAAVVVIESLRRLKANIVPYVNERSVDGYGICKAGIDEILKNHPETKLIITVDNGIVANEAIAYAKQKGLSVVVTDHHEPGEELPNADAVVDLKRKDETYPFHELCGAGIAFKLMLEVYGKKDNQPVLDTLDMVALATVADVVPLLEDNRAIVREGLKVIREGKRLAFSELGVQTQQQNISAHYTLAFVYAPIINSVSRMNRRVEDVVETFLCDDSQQVKEAISDFICCNEERKEITKQQTEIAMGMVDKENIPPVIVLFSEEFFEGIVGIIAGKLKNEFGRPVVVFARSNDLLKASCRSIGNFDIKGALDKMPEFTVGYGGHAKAAGVSIKPDMLKAFTEKITEIAQGELTEADLVETETIDKVLTANELNEESVKDLSLLEPYGNGFPQPLFGLIALSDQVFYMGKNKEHVKYSCENHISVIEWNGAEKQKRRTTSKSKFIGHPELNVWKGNVSVQFICNGN